MTREEHLAWCKKRALEYLDKGDANNAVASMESDMRKHPDTQISDTLSMLGMRYTACPKVFCHLRNQV